MSHKLVDSKFYTEPVFGTEDMNSLLIMKYLLCYAKHVP